jgi:Ca-activated chloride channel family protein
MPYKTPYGTIEYQMTEVRIDEPTMKKIAEITNGKYFRATNKETLRKVYKEIDQLEKTRIEVSEYRQKSEEYSYWVLTGLGLLLLDFLWLKIFQKSAVL